MPEGQAIINANLAESYEMLQVRVNDAVESNDSLNPRSCSQLLREEMEQDADETPTQA